MPGKPIDLVKQHKDDYVASKSPRLVDIASAKYLAISGRGAPGGEVFQRKAGALYGVAYTLKMSRKRNGEGPDYKVAPLEGFWWGDEPGHLPLTASSEWNWKLVVRTPDFITAREVAAAAKTLVEKGKGGEVREVKLETIREGRCVQALHVGPYASEPETIARMRDAAGEHGLAFHGQHHEIYLSDPRRVAEARLRTILRMPVR